MFSFLRRLSDGKRSVCPVSYIVVGVGNQGERYNNTRHNIGFTVADELVKKSLLVYRKKECSAIVSVVKIDGNITIAVAKPETFVNRSGYAVKELLARYKVPISSCLVIVDDFNLLLGTLRFRKQGSDGGHNGMKSIIAEMGKQFPRLRVGIGPLPEGVAVIDFVLGTFLKQELPVQTVVVQRAVEGIISFCTQGIEGAMTSFNRMKNG